LLATKLDVSRVLGLVFFDCHLGSPFVLTSKTHVVIARLCLLLPTPFALSAEGHSCSDNNTRSLSSEGHSLDLCAQMSPPAYPVRSLQLRALLGSHLISLLRKSALQQAGQPHARQRKGPVDVDRAVLCAVTAAAMPPPILLLAAALAS
jgi:hypothetical protein